MSTRSHPLTKLPLVTRRHLTIGRSLLRQPVAVLGLGVLVALVVTAIFAPVIAPHDPVTPNYSQTLESPSLEHPMGTDSFGRDVFSRVIYGTRVSVYVGLAIVFFGTLGGVPIGLLAGYYSDSLLDTVLMRLMDSVLAFPSIILALTIMAVLGGGTENVIIALSIANVPVFARLVRGSVLSVKEEEYITSAVAVGSTDRKIISRYVLPNVMAPIIVQGTLVFAFAVLNEAALSFLGIGTQPPTASWGLMLNEGKRFLEQAIWLTIFPGLSIMFTVLSLNFLGDGLRDVLDPKTTDDEMR